eukprot:2212930-Prymnesium_polylepis.1
MTHNQHGLAVPACGCGPVLARAQLFLLKVLLVAVRVLDQPCLALLAGVELGVDHLLLLQRADADARALKVLFDLDAHLQLHQAAEDSIDVGQDTICVRPQRVAQCPQRLNAVMDKQNLKAIALKLVRRGDQLAHVEHPGDLEPQHRGLLVVDVLHLDARCITIVALLQLEEEVT